MREDVTDDARNCAATLRAQIVGAKRSARSKSKSCAHSLPGTSLMPPSRPFSGRRRNSTLAIGAQRDEGRAAPQPAFALRRLARKRLLVAARIRGACAIHGHRAQAGRFGEQIVAPRSIIACAKSPERFGGSNDAASRLIPGLAAGNSSSTANSRAITRSTLPSTGTAGRIERDRGDRRGGVVADAGQRAQRVDVFGKFRAVPLDHGLRAGMQIAGARVIAKPRPGAQHIFEVGRRQRLDRRPARQEPRVIRRDGLDRRLLQHDLGQPDAVGSVRCARPRAPRQHARVPVVPGEKIGRPPAGVLSSARRSDCYGHGADDGIRPVPMSKPSRSFPRPLSELFERDPERRPQGAGLCLDRDHLPLARYRRPRDRRPQRAAQDQLAARRSTDEKPEPATLVLRVEGPAALEIQHLSAVILERVNRFFGWQAIGRIALRQAPLRRREPSQPPQNR